MKDPSHPHRRWTRDETVATLALYEQIPFGAMHHRNPCVIRLAQRLGRTPSSITLKLANFASLDPELRARGVVGMGNVTTLDRAVWGSHRHAWETLAEHADPDTHEAPASRTPDGGDTERWAETRVRRGQSFFRAAVLAAYNERCCVTGIATGALLRASHIVPWSVRPDARLDPRNGVCLNALHDSAFDQGLMTIDESFRVVYARRLWDRPHTDAGLALLRGFEGTKIELPERHRPLDEHLTHHRSCVFAD